MSRGTIVVRANANVKLNILRRIELFLKRFLSVQ